MLKTFSGLFLLLSLVSTALSLPLMASAAGMNPTSTGQLIKTADSKSVYYRYDGKRYTFPNEKIYFSWYQDFSSVITVSPEELAASPLAGNVTYKPGSRLIKIQTDPKVYTVSRYGILHWLNEAMANELYGSNWNSKIDDVEDTFFTNYIIGQEMTTLPPSYDIQEDAAITSIADNLRPANFVPGTASSAPLSKDPLLSVGVSTPQAVLNQTVVIFATVADNKRPIARIEIYQGQDSPLAICYNTLNCKGNYQVTQTTTTNLVFKARAFDDQGQKIETATGYQATLLIMPASPIIMTSAIPSQIAAGEKSVFSSNAGAFSNLSSHKMYLIIPGEPNPLLWRDCKTETMCQGSTPFYRTSQLFSKIVSNNQTFYSAAVTINVSGGTVPKPSLAVTSRPLPNQAVLKLTAPTGEGIGFSVIVVGTTPDNDTIALCDQSQCEITVQISAPQTYTAFTDVGGKLEASNSITVAL